MEPTAAAAANSTPCSSARMNAMGPDVSGNPTSHPLTPGPQRRPAMLTAPISVGVSTSFRVRPSTRSKRIARRSTSGRGAAAALGGGCSRSGRSRRARAPPAARRREEERRALALVGLAPDAAAHLLDDQANEIQAEAGSVGLEGDDVVRPVELLEEVSLALLGDPDAVVLDLPADELLIASQPDGNPAARARVLDGVRAQVEHDLPQELRVGEDLQDVLGDVHGDPVVLVV